MITIAVANKGRVQAPTLTMLDQIGVKVHTDGRRLFVPTSRSDVRVVLARVNDIPYLVERGAADIGITGQDAVAERRVRVKEFLPLGFGKCQIALAARQRRLSPGMRIATSMPNIARKFCRLEGLRATIITLEGALESAPHPQLKLADAIIDHVDTGTTLAENHLRVVRVIMESQMCLIGNPAAYSGRPREIDEIILLLQGLLAARERVILKVNAATPAIRRRLLKHIPAMQSPDVTPLAAPGACSLLAAVPRSGLERLIMRLKAAGGTDILVDEPKFIIP